MSLPAVPDEAWQRLDALIAAGGRRLLGLVGPPGAGKSALAALLQAGRPQATQVVPMDGFHLAQSELLRLGSAERKGAPDTFDAAGFDALLQRLRAQRPGDAPVYAPDFRRPLGEPVAGAIAVDAGTPLLVVEGNYLLLGEGGWAPVAARFDEVWYLDTDEPARIERLVARHVRHGRSPDAARDWVLRSDEANARRIAATRGRAHWRLHWETT